MCCLHGLPDDLCGALVRYTVLGVSDMLPCLPCDLPVDRLKAPCVLTLGWLVLSYKCKSLSCLFFTHSSSCLILAMVQVRAIDHLSPSDHDLSLSRLRQLPGCPFRLCPTMHLSTMLVCSRTQLLWSTTGQRSPMPTGSQRKTLGRQAACHGCRPRNSRLSPRQRSMSWCRHSCCSKTGGAMYHLTKHCHAVNIGVRSAGPRPFSPFASD